MKLQSPLDIVRTQRKRTWDRVRDLESAMQALIQQLGRYDDALIAFERQQQAKRKKDER